MERTKLHDLLALAHETSSERRRELLRGITDLFFPTDGERAGQEMALFDDIMSQLASEFEEAVRVELADRMASAPQPPHGLLQDLARDQAIAVARPILTRSAALTDHDLLIVARTRGQEHLRAITERPTVSEAVSEAIVERGDDHTLNLLLRNEGAALSRESAERVVDRAHA